MTFRIPRRFVRWLSAGTAVLPLSALVFVAMYFPVDFVESLALRLALPIGATALLIGVMAWLHVPVVIEEDGFRLAWVQRMKWSDVTGARIRELLGVPLLEITQRRGTTWRLDLTVYEGLPEFLARHAPEGNPLRELGRGA